MLDLILKDTFGKYYIIKTSRQNTARGLLQALNFTDKNRAFSFACNLCVPHGYWRLILYSVERGNLSSIHAKSTSGRHSAEHRIAEYLYRRRVYIYELVNYSASKGSQGKRSFEQRNGDRYTFSHVSTQLLASAQQPIELDSEADIGKLLWDLSFNEKQLNELAQALNLVGAENTGGAQSRDLVIGAIMAGEIIVRHQPKPSTPPKPLELLEPTAADRPMQGPASSSATEPVAPTAAAPPGNVPDPRTQAETLEKAAEDGVPFCEECEKAKAAQAS
ncbi:MAG TPA: hypothetical protein ENJ08_17280 [Gammaproteobacteria bacterium]|nr:hypothetical protein [Gammaproteobacteria bacterium]